MLAFLTPNLIIRETEIQLFGAMHMASAEIERRRTRMRKLVWELSSKVNRKLLAVGFVLLCVNLSAIVMLLVDGAVKDVPMTGTKMIAAFMFFVGALAGFMIMHRGTERAWL
jgi:hypothetical protein